MRFDFLLAENLAHRALDKIGETSMPGWRAMLARMARQQKRRPQTRGSCFRKPLVSGRRMNFHFFLFGSRCTPAAYM
jgi:hypothetical protein